MAFFARYSLSRHFWRQETTVTKEKGRSKESSTMAVCGVLRFLSLVSDDLLTLATICVLQHNQLKRRRGCQKETN